MGNRDQMVEESKKTTEVHIASLEGQYNETKDALLDQIINMVCDIKPESHINARIE